MIADTGSNEDNKNKIKEFIKNKKCRLVEYDYYHFSEINNEVVENHLDDSTTLLLFCNDDIELLNDAVSEMVSVYHKNKKVCGTIGARLHFGDNTVQHDGVFLFSIRFSSIKFKPLYLESFAELHNCIKNLSNKYNILDVFFS